MFEIACFFHLAGDFTVAVSGKCTNGVNGHTWPNDDRDDDDGDGDDRDGWWLWL